MSQAPKQSGKSFQVNNLDISAGIDRKLAISAKKYPAKIFKGKTSSEQIDAWTAAKSEYNKTKEGL